MSSTTIFIWLTGGSPALTAQLLFASRCTHPLICKHDVAETTLFCVHAVSFLLFGIRAITTGTKVPAAMYEWLASY